MNKEESQKLAKEEISENRYHSNLMDQCIKASNGSYEEAEKMYIERRSFELRNVGHISGEKELTPMLMPLIVIYAIGIVLTGWLVYHFVSQ